MNREFRPVKDYEHYEVSNDGVVRSRERRTPVVRTDPSGPHLRYWPAKERRPFINKDGYRTVTLTGSGQKRRTVHVHVLVAEGFLGPRPAGAVIRHLDGNPANNHVSNLAYGTPQENSQDMLRHGTGQASKTACPSGHPYDEENTYRPPTGGRICRACNRAAAREYQRRLRVERNVQ